jgi:hypothetical protein
MKKAASTSETSVNVYEITQRKIPEDIHLHTRRRENLNFHEFSFFFYLMYVQLDVKDMSGVNFRFGLKTLCGHRSSKYRVRIIFSNVIFMSFSPV